MDNIDQNNPFANNAELFTTQVENPTTGFKYDEDEEEEQVGSTTTNPPHKLYIGYEVPEGTTSIDESLNYAFEQGFDYVVNELTDSNDFHSELNVFERHRFSQTEILLKTSQWSNTVLARLNPKLFKLLELGGTNAEERKSVKQAMKLIAEEISFGQYLSVPAYLLPCPTELNIAHYSSIISQHSSEFKMPFWVRVPVNQWHIFNELKLQCDHSASILPVVELVELEMGEQEIFWEKWFGESLIAVIVPIQLLNDELINNANSNSYTYVHKFLTYAFKHERQIILTSTPSSALTANATSPISDKDMREYVNYLYVLYDTLSEPLTEIEEFEKPYRDYLQAPLQPLFHNLESQTYEIFEQDPVKYSLYQQAVKKALLQDQFKDLETIVIMVVGAGRGPLVKASLKAAKETQKKVKIYAVEKNPNALVILHHYTQSIWRQLDVTIIHSDMRVWNPPHKADILVSELLGSFGDNELSPECLDGAQKLLKDNGISIPTSYTSYAAPLMSQKVFNEVKILGSNSTMLKAFETPYVVQVFNGVSLAEPQPCFTFVHPNHEQPQPDNSRYTVMNFTCSKQNSAIASTLPVFKDESTTPPSDRRSTQQQKNNKVTADQQQQKSTKETTSTGNNEMMIHGLIGYFECVLYDDVIMSILPSSFSPEMFSWFPIVFPLTQPMTIKNDSQIQVHFYRKGDHSKVWYEWLVRDLTSNQTSTLHNVNGRSYSIGL